jgi:hypothetical protein
VERGGDAPAADEKPGRGHRVWDDAEHAIGRRRHTLWLGVSPGLTDAHIDHVNATIRNFVQKEDGLQPVMPPVHAVFCGPPRTLACHHQLH